MARYLLKRFLYFIITCFAVALIAFVVTVLSPGDPVDRLTTYAQEGADYFQPVREIEKARLRHRLGLDLPLFYVSLHNAAEPDTLYRVFPALERKKLEYLLTTYGNWEAVSNWHRQLESFREHFRKVTKEEPNQSFAIDIPDLIFILRWAKNQDDVTGVLADFVHVTGNDSTLHRFATDAAGMKSAWTVMIQSRPTWRNYFPVLHIHGQNQFHQWLFGGGERRGILHGDFGLSYISRQPVSGYISDRLPWTLLLSVLAIVLAYAISIPLALRMAKKPGGFFDRRMSTVLQLMYSLPAFWVGALLLMLFANPDVLPLFPASGVKPVQGYPDGISFLHKIWISLPYFILPVLTAIFAFVAILSRLLRASLREEMKRDYYRTALAKGLPESTARKRHAFRNTLLPAITLFAEIFPIAVGGSVIIENIFSIPGMGWGIFQAIQSQDYPVMVSMFTLSGLVTMAGYLLADVLYALLDPRIRYS